MVATLANSRRFGSQLAARTQTEGAPIYFRWIAWVWQGQVAQVIAEVAARAAGAPPAGWSGPPPDDAGESDHRQIIAATLT